MRLSFPSFRAAAIGLALVAASRLASPAPQGRSAEDTRTIDGYRLTMPVLRNVLPALHAPGHSDNALLLEQNDPELRKLSNNGADS
jgi:hypothetical protein